jgi:hypothetical protein
LNPLETPKVTPNNVEDLFGRTDRRAFRPDIIVGTSMGSIVGGLYASGMSGPELQHAVESMDWDAIFDAMPEAAGGRIPGETQLARGQRTSANSGRANLRRQPPPAATPTVKRSGGGSDVR